jgi:RND family efflux transporter MFP subunit
MSEKIPHPSFPARLGLALGIFAVLATTIAVAGIFIRRHHDQGLQKTVESQHTTVKVVNPEFGPSNQTLILPGNIRAYIDAPIYARVSGYLKVWYTDIGAHVHKGQVLGEIEIPELDEQIMRAQANAATAESSWDLAEITAKRWSNLLATNSVSHQEADEKAADAKSKKDILNAARANLKALQAEQSFKRITSPFDGVVTERNTDIGQLISASNSSGKPLFRVVDSRKLRIFVEVPQSSAQMIKTGMAVEVHLPERPSEVFTATVLTSSDSIHESSRTATVELLMENKTRSVFSGSYAEVHFQLASPTNVFRLPVSTLLFRKNGLEVATVNADNRVQMKKIAIARDLGRIVEVATGIESTDRVIDNPSDSIVQGDIVQIKAAEVLPATTPKSGAAS